MKSAAILLAQMNLLALIIMLARETSGKGQRRPLARSNGYCDAGKPERVSRFN